MNETTEAVDLFRKGYTCSQAILAAYAPSMGLDPEVATRIAAPFATGMRVGGVCGAATGAFMVLGLALCTKDCIVREGRTTIAASVSKFSEAFRERSGALNCQDILGCDVRTPEGLKVAREGNLFGTRCVKAVQDASEILQEMLPRS